jgi:CubicO group peptidase (beta-lactamase class C family)
VVTSNTVFDLASVSKQFTGIALLILVQRGKLLMEDDVRKYVPEVPVFDSQRPIKISDLSNHTSGLPDPRPDETPTETATFAWLSKQTKLDFPTGSQWAYRNLNYFVLGRVVERVSGEKLRPFLEREVFLPAGMKPRFWTSRMVLYASERLGTASGNRADRITVSPALAEYLRRLTT